jgi:glycosyltransferase involved in cell wall biosynthesis
MLAPEFPPTWGGAGTYTVELLRHLPKSVVVHVVAPSRERLAGGEAKTSDYDFDQLFSNNVHVHFVSTAADTFFYNAAFQYGCLKYVPELLRRECIDVIHSHTAHMPDLLLQLRKLRLPTITTLHSTIAQIRRATKESETSFRDLQLSEKATYLGYPLLRLAEQIYFSSERHYISVSNWFLTQLPRRPRGSTVRVIPNSVDTEFFTPGRQTEEPVVLFMGRLLAMKGIKYLIDAIPKVLQQHPEAMFVFAGPGDSTPYRSKLRALHVPSRNFSFPGYLKNRKEILNAYRRSAIVVLPGMLENFPTSILEAMACEKPVVATNVGAIPEAITAGQEGMLIPPKSSEALAGAISDLLSDPQRRLKMGRNGRQKVVERFDWSVNAERTAAFYEWVLHSTS